MSIKPDRHVKADDVEVSDASDEYPTIAHQAAQLLAARPEQDWRLQELAHQVHLSTSQLGRTFSRYFGIPPMRYLARVRAHRLAQLLTETDLPIGVAMKQVGWNSRGHAARQFASIIGVSPSEYRREAGSRDDPGSGEPVLLQAEPLLTLQETVNSRPSSRTTTRGLAGSLLMFQETVNSQPGSG